MTFGGIYGQIYLDTFHRDVCVGCLNHRYIFPFYSFLPISCLLWVQVSYVLDFVPAHLLTNKGEREKKCNFPTLAGSFVLDPVKVSFAIIERISRPSRLHFSYKISHQKCMSCNISHLWSCYGHEKGILFRGCILILFLLRNLRAVNKKERKTRRACVGSKVCYHQQCLRKKWCIARELWDSI